MDRLVTFVKAVLMIPYIENEDTVLDKCFACNPVMTNSLSGNGAVQTISSTYHINLFYESKTDIVEKAILLKKELSKAKGFYSSEPSFSYEKEGKKWRAMLICEIQEGAL